MTQGQNLNGTWPSTPTAKSRCPGGFQQEKWGNHALNRWVSAANDFMHWNQAFTHGKVVMFDSNSAQMLYLLPFHCYLHPTLSNLPYMSVEWKVSVCDTTDDFRFTTWFHKKSWRTLTTIPDSIISQRFQPTFMREFPKNHHIFQWSSSSQLFDWLRHTLTHLRFSENAGPQIHWIILS